MGGYIGKLRVWWHYEFEDQEVLHRLKVHILEMLADVVQVALVDLGTGLPVPGLDRQPV